MFCPQCGAEFRPGFSECSDCHVSLVSAPPPVREASEDNLESTFVTVFQSSNPALIGIARSLLESAGIPFMTRGEGIQDLFALGRIAGGTNPITGLVDFVVNAEDARDADLLLADVAAGIKENEIDSSDQEPD